MGVVWGVKWVCHTQVPICKQCAAPVLGPRLHVRAGSAAKDTDSTPALNRISSWIGDCAAASLYTPLHDKTSTLFPFLPQAATAESTELEALKRQLREERKRVADALGHNVRAVHACAVSALPYTTLLFSSAVRCTSAHTRAVVRRPHCVVCSLLPRYRSRHRHAGHRPARKAFSIVHVAASI